LAAFLASLPWLEEMDQAVKRPIGVAIALFVIAWSILLATRVERSLDEVQLAGQRFAQAKGAGAGTIVLCLLLLLRPVKDELTDIVIHMTTQPELGEPIDQGTVRAAMTFGIVLLVVMQALGMVVFSAIWNRRIGGNG
jgi:cobalamin synthase